MEDYPGSEVVGEALETMLDSSGYEKHVTRTERVANTAVYELPAARDDEVELVLVVWGLWIMPSRSIESHGESCTLEQRRKARRAIVWTRQFRRCLVYRKAKSRFRGQGRYS